MSNLANRIKGCSVTFEFQINMKNFSVSCAILGTSPAPRVLGQSFICPRVGAKAPGARQAPLPRYSGLLPSPLSPPAPPRLQLVAGPGGLRCAGVVEFYSGSLGGTISYEARGRTQDLGDHICAALQCGSFLKHLPEAEVARAQDPWESRPLPIRWVIENTSCASLEQCFQKVQPREDGQVLALVCSGE